MDAWPPDALCERCYGRATPAEGAVRFGHLAGSTLHGDVTWTWTFLHRFDPATGCVREPG